MIFTDAHIHFLDPSVFTYPWLARHPELVRPHTPAELDRETDGDAPGRMVFIQAECVEVQALEEVRWIDRLAEQDPRIAAIIAYCRMDDSKSFAARLKSLLEYARVRGIRHLIQGEADPDFSIRPNFVRAVRQCGAANLLFELCCVADQLPNVIRLVEQCPGTRFVLDHAGKPDIRSARLDPWREHINTLASFPHVVCKLSALVTQARHNSWQPADLRPYWDHAISAFGPARLLFGSDWPVLKLASSYRRWFQTATTMTANLSSSDRAAIFHHNATRVYHIC